MHFATMLQAHAARSLHKADGTGSETAGTTAAKKTARGKAQTSAPATRHAALGGQKRLTFWQLCPSFAINKVKLSCITLR